MSKRDVIELDTCPACGCCLVCQDCLAQAGVAIALAPSEAVKAVREWQYWLLEVRTVGGAFNQDQEEQAAEKAAWELTNEHVTVLDPNDVVPLLRALSCHFASEGTCLDITNDDDDVCAVPGCTYCDLARAFDRLSPEWRALVEEESDGQG